jgi:hypothetical protein
MSRTTQDLVIGILRDDYDTGGFEKQAADLTPYIDTANAVVDRVNKVALKRAIILTPVELELIERWLSAHFYSQSDKPYQSKSTEGASASFTGQTGMGLESSLYGQTAMRIDYSGALFNLNSQQRASCAWLGKPPSSQIPYSHRD